MKRIAFSKIIDFLKWLAARAGVFYLVIFLLLFISVDLKLIWGNARIRAMNRIMPMFDDLAEQMVHQKPLTREQWQEYASYYRTVTQLIPDDGAAYFFLGYCQSHLNLDDQALVNFKKAVELVPAMFWFEYNLGVAYFNRGDYETAGNFFKRSIKDGPVLAQFYMKNSTIYKQILVSALNIGFDPETSFKESFADALLMTVKCFYHSGKYDQALQEARSHLKQGLSSDDYYYLIALSLKEQGKFSDMIGVVQLLLEKDPDHVEAWQMALDLFTMIDDQQNMRTVKAKLELLRRAGMEGRLSGKHQFHAI